MVPSFFISTPPLQIIQGTANDTVPPPNQTHSPPSAAYPYLISTYTESPPHKEGTFSNTPKLFFRKMGKNSLLGNVSDEKIGKSICSNVRKNNF